MDVEAVAVVVVVPELDPPLQAAASTPMATRAAPRARPEGGLEVQVSFPSSNT